MSSVEEMLGRRVREQRRLAGFTQARLAEKVGVSNETICRMETAKCMPSLYTIERIARVLRVDLRELFRSRRDTSDEDEAIDRLVWLMRRHSAADIDFVIDIVTRIFDHARAHHAADSKRANRST